MNAARLFLVAVLGLTGPIFAAAPAVPTTRITRPPTPTVPLAPATRLTRPPAAQPAPAQTLDAFLESAPALKDRIAWIAGNGQRVNFADWTAAQKARLELFYRRIAAHAPDLTIKLPTEKDVDQSGHFYYTADVAFDVYAAQVAHVLYVEARRLVPWSIQALPAGQMDELLNSSAYFARIGPSKGNTYPAGIQAGRDFTDPPENDGLGELIGDPRIGYDFVSGKTSATHKSLIGKTELETLANLTVWLRDNVTHGPLEGDAVARVKVQRWLDQRLQPSKGSKTAMAVTGCHSGAKLLVDLARSVNIPLLHVRALDNELGDGAGHFFSRTHGGLIYGWGGPRQPRVLWHVDDIYASTCDTCFPIDPKTGALAAPDVATQMFFDEMWMTPPALLKAGFVYKLEKVFPEKGFGHDGRGAYEDRIDYGMMCGYWKKQGKSDLGELFLLTHAYAVCGEPLLTLQANNVLEAQLTDNIKGDIGGLPASDYAAPHTMAEFSARAAAGLKALGGAGQLKALMKKYDDSRGNNLMVP
jgi:hypothetical protein